MSFELSADYRQWLQQLKSQFQHTQQNAVRAVNTEMLKFYWQLGEQIAEQQQNFAWGEGFLKQLSHDLMTEFPEIKGFSKRNLEYVRRWYLFWSQDMSITQQLVAQLGQVQSGHFDLITKCKSQVVYRQANALSDVNKPIGISAYALNDVLPSVAQLEEQLKDFGGEG